MGDSSSQNPNSKLQMSKVATPSSDKQTVSLPEKQPLVQPKPASQLDIENKLAELKNKAKKEN
jgi:hypothetical protein